MGFFCLRNLCYGAFVYRLKCVFWRFYFWIISQKMLTWLSFFIAELYVWIIFLFLGPILELKFPVSHKPTIFFVFLAPYFQDNHFWQNEWHRLIYCISLIVSYQIAIFDVFSIHHPIKMSPHVWIIFLFANGGLLWKHGFFRGFYRIGLLWFLVFTLAQLVVQIFLI